MIDSYRGRNVIVRSSQPTEIVDCLRNADLKNVRFIQLLSTPQDCGILESTAESVPIEIALTDPATNYAQLYKYVTLLDTHPVRIAIPVVPGFSNAAKLAVALNFAVKLELEQPDGRLIDEVISVLDLYLHRSNVQQPIEFFQTMLLSFYRDEPISLWEIAEEDPTQVRYITDDGEETISKRFAGQRLNGGVEDFVDRYSQQMLLEKSECNDCEFFLRCRSYFKWPDKTYECTGVKKLFRTLGNAAEELKQDLAGFQKLEVQQQP